MLLVCSIQFRWKQTWEIINKGKLSTYAYNPQIISNGNIVVANVQYSDIIAPDEVSPVLIDSKSRKSKFIKITDNYCYTDLFVSDKFFICGIDPQELITNSNIKEWYAQISNEGEIIYQNGCMNTPSGKFLFISESSFINMTVDKIKKKTLNAQNH